MITTVGGTPTPHTAALAEALAAERPGQAVTITVARHAQELTVHLTVGEFPGD